ncbi:hypothetical protein HDU88_002246 [Geranomyces variabilis]|nr:hypothetical protein HDU88_002246 [Geranomyces variabilis]
MSSGAAAVAASAASSLLFPPRGSSSASSRRQRAATALAPYLASSRRHRWAAATLAVAALASVLGTTAYCYYYLHSSSSTSSSAAPPAPTAPDSAALPNSHQQPPQTSTDIDSAAVEATAPSLANTVVAAARSLFSGSSVVVTISMKNIIVWNPSPDPATPNHAFRESALPYLQSLVKLQNPRIQIHLITVVSSDEEEVQIRELLKASGLYADGLDERRVLFCGTEEGKAHLVRHIEPAVHVDQNDEVIERLAPYVKRLVRVRRTVIGSPQLGGVRAAPAAARTASAPGSTTAAASSARTSHESLQQQHEDMHTHPHAHQHNPLLSHHLHHHPHTPSPLATSRRLSSAAGGSPSSNASSASLARTPTLTKLDGVANDPTSSETLYRPATPSPPNHSNILIPLQQSSPPHPSPLALHARHPSAGSAKDMLLTATSEVGGGGQQYAEGDSPAQRLARRFPNVEFVECFAQAKIETPYAKA